MRPFPNDAAFNPDPVANLFQTRRCSANALPASLSAAIRRCVQFRYEGLMTELFLNVN
jgi:hypothetical protein